MRSSIQIEIRTSAGTQQVALSGVVDEDADLRPLDGLAGEIELNLRGVRRFNSIGTRDWIAVMRRLAPHTRILLVECSTAVIGQLNMISEFLAHGLVRSFFAPMRCPACEQEREHLFDARDCVALDGLPPVACTACATPLDLDELADQYLLFLREPDVVG